MSTKLLYNLGQQIIGALEYAYELIVTTPIRDLVNVNPVIDSLWKAIVDTFHIPNISLFVLMLGVGLSLWVTIGVVKFFLSVYRG